MSWEGLGVAECGDPDRDGEEKEVTGRTLVT